jgi:hypothetical protein
MRNLLTALGANRNYEISGEKFSGHIANFFNSWQANFPRSQAYKHSFAQEFCPYVCCRALRWQNSSIEIGFLFSEQREIALPGSCEAKRA